METQSRPEGRPMVCSCRLRPGALQSRHLLGPSPLPERCLPDWGPEERARSVQTHTAWSSWHCPSPNCPSPSSAGPGPPHWLTDTGHRSPRHLCVLTYQRGRQPSRLGGRCHCRQHYMHRKDPPTLSIKSTPFQGVTTCAGHCTCWS